MLHSLFTLRRHHPHFQHILSSLSLIPTTHHHFSTTTPLTTTTTTFSLTHNAQVDLSRVYFHGFAQSLLSSEPALLDKPRAHASLKTHLLEVSTVVPEITRRFWRVPGLKPEHVFQILMGFRSECVRVGIRVEKVRSLYEIFKWGGEKNMGFQHLSQSYEIMTSLLVEVGLLREAGDMLSALEGQGVLLNRSEIFDKLIEGYVGGKELERAVFVYDCMKGRGMVPSRSCYRVLLDHLARMKRTQLALRVAFDLVDLGVPLSGAEMNTLENMMVLLCINGKIQEARSLVRKIFLLNSEVSSLVFDEIAFGYCEKDFKDLLSFFVEVKCAPTVKASNRLINSLCSSYGVENAEMFLQELES